MNTPTPPPGYKLEQGLDYIPSDSLVFINDSWEPYPLAYTYNRESFVPEMHRKLFYAIPASTPMQDIEAMEQSITDEAKTIVDDPYQIHIGGVKCDPYRIARAYGINDPVIFQALKKLLRCGRKHKDQATDVREAITSLERWEQMNQEDSK